MPNISKIKIPTSDTPYNIYDATASRIVEVDELPALANAD